MKPQCVVTVNGQSVTDAFLRRLSECEVVDRDGVTSDSVRLRLDDDPPAEIPQPGARIEVSLGYEGSVVSMGSYVAEEVEDLVHGFRERVATFGEFGRRVLLLHERLALSEDRV